MPLLVGEGGEEGYREEREQLLALNQVLARQVMERSRNIIGNMSLLFKSVQYPNVQMTKRPNKQCFKQPVVQTNRPKRRIGPNDQSSKRPIQTNGHGEPG